MRQLKFLINVPVVVTFLSKKSDPYQRMTAWGEKTYHNYTVTLNKVNGNPVNERRVLVATDYLESFLAAKNVVPGAVAKIAMIEKGNGHTGWTVEVADKLVSVQEEAPGEPDRITYLEDCEDMRKVYDEMWGYFTKLAETSNTSPEIFIPSINSIYIQAKQAGNFDE